MTFEKVNIKNVIDKERSNQEVSYHFNQVKKNTN
jgi:hypothetical protein